jgi:hypothetical protein
VNLVLDVVDEILGLLAETIDDLLCLAARAVGLTFSLQVLVVGEIADSFLRSAFEIISV